MRKFVIADIHGSYGELVELLGRIKADFDQDQVTFLGDYIDRGPNSWEVIQFLIDLQKKYGKDHIVLLRGNHEQMAIDTIHSGNNRYSNGYDETVRSFIRNKDCVENYLEFFNSLPLYYEDDNLIYVHGGIRPGVSIQHQVKDDLLLIREEFFNSPKTFEKPVIFGHTPTMYISGSCAPHIRKDRIGIDTGAVFGGYLTAIEISHGEIVEIYQSGKLAA